MTLNKVNAGLVVDFGNSATRVLLLLNKRAYRFNLSNRFAMLPTGYDVPLPYQSSEKTAIFNYSGERIANGAIVEREFPQQSDRPSAMHDKTEQLVTSYTVNRLFIRSLRIIAEMTQKQLADLDVDFKVTVLLPPEEQESKGGKMIELIKNVSEVDSVYPTTFKKGYRVGSVSVIPEGLAALFGAIYHETGRADLSAHNEGKLLDNGDVIVRDNADNLQFATVPGNERFHEGYLLVIDVGAGTADFALVLDMELVEGSRATYNVAGNNVTNAVKMKVKSKFKLEPRNMEEAIRTASVLEGDATVHHIEDLVTDAKRSVALRLKQYLVEYLELQGVAPRNIRGMLVAGGGGEPSIREGEVVSPPLSLLLTEYIKELAPNIANVPTGDVPLRELNIEGAYFLHKY